MDRQWSILTDPYANVNSFTAHQRFVSSQQQVTIQKIVSEINVEARRIAVFGMRGVGKTTLLNQLALTCRESAISVAKMSCKSFSTQYTYAHFLREILQEWQNSLEILYPDFVSPLPSWIRQATYTREITPRFKADILKIVEAIQNQTDSSVRFALILDEVDHIFPGRESPEETYHQYRELAQILKSVIEAPELTRVVSIVVAMEYPWIHLLDNFPHNNRFQNPLFGCFQCQQVELFQREDLNEMVQTIGASVGLDYTPASLYVLHYQSSGHPEITQNLCNCLVELRDNGEIKNPITAGDVDLALNYFLEDSFGYAYYLEAAFWENPLSPDLDREQRLILQLAKEENLSKSNLISRLLEHYRFKTRTGNLVSDRELDEEKKKLENSLCRLIDLQLVSEDKEQGTYTISIPLYKDWLRHEILPVEMNHYE